MNDNFDVALLRRSLGIGRGHRSIKQLYGHRSWAEDLDIVNELGGHTGCVNALSWSTSGGLLASGSDDTYLNIWEYNPSNLARPFTLNTSVSTGHHANIFSVKFMPHSNDRTIVTCAGDSEVRVFDLEYGGASQTAPADSAFSASTRSRRFNEFFPNTRWLTDSNTNARVYRSHADRAKRIVTESSPFLFLSCSEDGEVRQWDLRLPSSSYPAPRGGRSMARFRRSSGEVSDNIPPPLISYKKYALDLNSISCAASQPQYIALGGAHLHCFLHDRRMLGRDLLDEMGKSTARKPTVGLNEDDSMGTATRCVKRFAPHNKRRMNANDHGHITACKISDANPNEMVASWSGDYIYSFDIVKSPDARDADVREDENFAAHRLKNFSDRKRKRKVATASSASPVENSNPSRRLRRVSEDRQEEGQTALRVRYENGDVEDIEVSSIAPESNAPDQSSHHALLTEAQRRAEQVAKSLVKLRKTLFDFSAMLTEGDAESMEHSEELTPHAATFTNSLGQCSTLLPEMSDIIRSWSYPINPTDEDVSFQNTLRRNRQSSWRFVQAAGCLCQVLGGRLQTLSSAPDPRLVEFSVIKPATHEGTTIRRESRFCYDFLKAILCWLEGGQESVLKAFKRPASVSGDSIRYPINDADNKGVAIEKLRDYLSGLADENKSIVDLDANRFERDERRIVFENQKAAVWAFTRALTGVELELRQGISEVRTDISSENSTKRVMDKGAASRFWGVKVGRSLLMEAAEGITFDFVNQAFGGLRLHVLSDPELVERSQEDIDPNEEERVVEAVDVVMRENDENVAQSTTTDTTAVQQESVDVPQQQTGGLNESNVDTTIPHVVIQDTAEDDDDDENENDESEDEESDLDAEEDEDGGVMHPLFRRHMGIGRSRRRTSVNMHVPYSSNSRTYKGHCNTRTVKDVNYYGLNDEYVVSGSDDGHFFIWDRKTCKIVNILEGDGEVVNVVQGHPCEPMIACSGIDSTIKIFGPGGNNRERDAASRGLGSANPGGGVHSSLRYGGRRARRGRHHNDADEDEDEDRARVGDQSENGAKLGGLKSRKAMHKEYEITSQNDAERRRGMGDAFVTEGMLARFAAALQRGQIQAVTGQGFGGTGATIVVDDNCLVGCFPVTANFRHWLCEIGWKIFSAARLHMHIVRLIDVSGVRLGKTGFYSVCINL